VSGLGRQYNPLLLLASVSPRPARQPRSACRRGCRPAKERKTRRVSSRSHINLPPQRAWEGEGSVPNDTDRYRVIGRQSPWGETPAVRRPRVCHAAAHPRSARTAATRSRRIAETIESAGRFGAGRAKLSLADRSNHLAKGVLRGRGGPSQPVAATGGVGPRPRQRTRMPAKPRRRAAATPLRSARDHYLLATAEAEPEAITWTALLLLREATQQRTAYFAAWSPLGPFTNGPGGPERRRHSMLFHRHRSLGPQRHWLLLRRPRFELPQAAGIRAGGSDFDEAVRLRPDVGRSRISTALSLGRGLQKYAEASTTSSTPSKSVPPYHAVYYACLGQDSGRADAAGGASDR